MRSGRIPSSNPAIRYSDHTHFKDTVASNGSIGLPSSFGPTMKDWELTEIEMESIPGLDAWLTRGPEEVEHDPRCPGHDDWQCGNCVSEESDYCEHGLVLDCICADLEEQAKSDRAEAKADEARERKYNP